MEEMASVNDSVDPDWQEEAAVLPRRGDGKDAPGEWPVCVSQGGHERSPVESEFAEVMCNAALGREFLCALLRAFLREPMQND